MTSKHLRKLRKNQTKLKQEFLNFRKRTDGAYSDDELLRCRAYQTFVHAEIEHYLEQMAASALARARTAWDSKGTVGRIITSLIIYRNEKKVPIPDDPGEINGANKLASVIIKAFVNQKNVIENNNGIRKRDFSNLFLPLGLDPIIIPPTLLIQLDLMGQRRGDLVHKASHVSLALVRDPFDDVDSDISNLINELDDFDKKLLRLR